MNAQVGVVGRPEGVKCNGTGRPVGPPARVQVAPTLIGTPLKR
jgi:hypothetical protein